jgi:hypothetical protein
VSDEEAYWINHSKEIYRNGSYVLYDLSFDKVFSDASDEALKKFEIGQGKTGSLP